MAALIGSFDKDIVAVAMFDEVSQTLGWFDRDMIDFPAAAIDLTTVTPAVYQLVNSGGYVGQVYV